MSETQLKARKFRRWCKDNDIGLTTGYVLLNSGKLKTFKIGRDRYILNTEGDRFLASQVREAA